MKSGTRGEELLTAEQVGARLGCSSVTVRHRANAGLLPRPRRLGSRGVRWLGSELEAHVRSLPSAGFRARRKVQ